jgi:hypothetical protein
MANAIAAGSAPSIPQYVADGYSGSGSNRTLTFSGGAPPSDGSIGLAFIVLNITGLSFADNAYQRLAYWADASPGKAQVTGISGISTVDVYAWSFLADAS